jgi:hypothetical protein
MARPTATPTARRSSGTLSALAALGLAATALPGAAGPLADPTRPPTALMAPGGLAAATLPHRANLDTARAIAAAARAADATPPAPPPTVQAVQLPANGSALALVDGRQVQVGDQLDGRAVLAIDAQGLLLKGPRGPERLLLLGGTPKQAAGSITHSQSARYLPAATPGLPADGQAATPAARGPANAPASSTTSAAPGSLSLAGRTTP